MMLVLWKLLGLLVSMTSADVPESALMQVFPFVRLFNEKYHKDLISSSNDLSYYLEYVYWDPCDYKVIILIGDLI